MKVFLVRHASPDWARTDIPYDIPPGPPLSPKGEQEALDLAKYLQSENVRKLYYSPFERSARTAHIVSAANAIPCVEEKGLLEWRESAETREQVRTRMFSVFERIAREGQEVGAIGLVSHGGPVSFLLQALGMKEDELASYGKRFDRSNPLPPAGAWKVERCSNGHGWDLQLSFVPLVK
jgi:2,3-bisphosphoglycerate-dependent phosphoglycerate mutase